MSKNESLLLKEGTQELFMPLLVQHQTLKITCEPEQDTQTIPLALDCLKRNFKRTSSFGLVRFTISYEYFT